MLTHRPLNNEEKKSREQIAVVDQNSLELLM